MAVPLVVVYSVLSIPLEVRACFAEGDGVER